MVAPTGYSGELPRHASWYLSKLLLSLHTACRGHHAWKNTQTLDQTVHVTQTILLVTRILHWRLRFLHPQSQIQHASDDMRCLPQRNSDKPAWTTHCNSLQPLPSSCHKTFVPLNWHVPGWQLIQWKRSRIAFETHSFWKAISTRRLGIDLPIACRTTSRQSATVAGKWMTSRWNKRISSSGCVGCFSFRDAAGLLQLWAGFFISGKPKWFEKEITSTAAHKCMAVVPTW